MEGAAAHLEVGVPVTGGIIGLGGHIEVVEAIRALPHQPGVELAFRRVHFQGGGVSLGQGLAFVVKQQRQVHGVAGTPDATLPVNEAFEAFLEHLSAHVETTQGTFVTGVHLQVCHAAARLGHYGERLALDRDGDQALAIRLAGANLLQLEVVHFHAGAGYRLGAQDVRSGHPNLLTTGVFGHQAQVAGEQLDRREAVAVHIIGGLGGVVGLVPVVRVPIVVVVPIIGAGLVPLGLIFLGGFAGRRCRVQHRLLAAVQALVQAEAQADAVDGARLLLEQAAQVYAMAVPAVQVLGGIQGDVTPVHQAAAAAQGAVAIQVVVLQEHQDVLLIDFHNAHFHGTQVHRPERQDEPILIRQDAALQRNLHGGLILVQGESEHGILPQGLSGGVFDAFVQREGEVFAAAFEVHAQPFVLYLHVTADGPLQFHLPFLEGVHGGVAQLHVNVVTGQGGPQHAKAFAGLGLGYAFGLLRFRCPYGQAEVEALRRPFLHLAQEKAHRILLARKQGVRNEGH